MHVVEQASSDCEAGDAGFTTFSNYLMSWSHFRCIEGISFSKESPFAKVYILSSGKGHTHLNFIYLTDKQAPLSTDETYIADESKKTRVSTCSATSSSQTFKREPWCHLAEQGFRCMHRLKLSLLHKLELVLVFHRTHRLARNLLILSPSRHPPAPPPSCNPERSAAAGSPACGIALHRNGRLAMNTRSISGKSRNEGPNISAFESASTTLLLSSQ